MQVLLWSVSLTDCRLCERDGLFLGYQENWRSAGRNLHRVSERLLATFRSRACFQSLHRRKMYFGDAVEGRNTLRRAEYPCCHDLGLALSFATASGTCSCW